MRDKLEGSLPVTDSEVSKSGVPSLEEAVYKAFKRILTDQTQTITQLMEKLHIAVQKLHVQLQQDKDFFLKREHEWAEKVKTLEKKAGSTKVAFILLDNTLLNCRGNIYFYLQE